MQNQFAQALEERDHEKACFCLRSMIMHAASDFRVGMGKQISVYAKRAYTKYQKAAFLGKLFNKSPELHAMLRQPECTQPTPLTQPAWNAYLNRHFRSSAARGVRPRGLRVGSGLSLETWWCRLDVTPPPRSSATTRCSE